MIVEDRELFGIELSEYLMDEYNRIEHEIKYEKTRPFVPMEISMINFCNPMNLRLGRREIEKPENYKAFLAYNKVVKERTTNIPLELSMQMTPDELQIYCYLDGLSKYFDFHHLDWNEVCEHFAMPRREFFGALVELQSWIIEHPYFKYPLLITELTNEQLTDLGDCEEEDAYDLLQEYRGTIA